MKAVLSLRVQKCTVIRRLGNILQESIISIKFKRQVTLFSKMDPGGDKLPVIGASTICHHLQDEGTINNAP